MSRITRKKWSTDDLFNKFTAGARAGSNTPAPPKERSPLQKAAQQLESVEGNEVVSKKFFRVGHDELLVRFEMESCCSIQSHAIRCWRRCVH